jgi:hypothetical protein
LADATNILKCAQPQYSSTYLNFCSTCSGRIGLHLSEFQALCFEAMSLASTPQSYGPPAEPASSGQAGSSTAALPAENSANPPGSRQATSQPAAVISKLTEVATAAGAVGPTASHLKDLLRQQGSVCYSACRYASMVTQLVNTYVRTYACTCITLPGGHRSCELGALAP